MSAKQHIFVIDDDKSIRWVLEKALRQANMDVTSFDNAKGALESIKRTMPDAVITDIRMPGISGLELLENLRSQFPALPVIIITAHSDLDSAVSSYQGGAFEYLPKPFDVDEVVDLVHRAMDQRRRQQTKAPEKESAVPEIIGEAPPGEIACTTAVSTFVCEVERPVHASVPPPKSEAQRKSKPPY